MIKVVSEMHDDYGNIIGYETVDGRILAAETVMEMLREVRITGVISGVNENGERVIHILNDTYNEEPVNPMNRFEENDWMVYAKKTIF